MKFPFKKTQTVHLANSPSKYSLPLPTLSLPFVRRAQTKTLQLSRTLGRGKYVSSVH